MQDFSFGLGDKTQSTEFSCGKSDGIQRVFDRNCSIIHSNFDFSVSADSITEGDRRALVSIHVILRWTKNIRLVNFLGDTPEYYLFSRKMTVGAVSDQNSNSCRNGRISTHHIQS